eukprot:scaffold1748_cov258-Pinguiococcus_pyrenoidosus.AAC.20
MPTWPVLGAACDYEEVTSPSERRRSARNMNASATIPPRHASSPAPLKSNMAAIATVAYVLTETRSRREHDGATGSRFGCIVTALKRDVPTVRRIASAGDNQDVPALATTFTYRKLHVSGSANGRRACRNSDRSARAIDASIGGGDHHVSAGAFITGARENLDGASVVVLALSSLQQNIPPKAVYCRSARYADGPTVASQAIQLQSEARARLKINATAGTLSLTSAISAPQTNTSTETRRAPASSSDDDIRDVSCSSVPPAYRNVSRARGR